MAFEAKALFLKELEGQFSTMLTATDMAKVLSVVSGQLSYYDMTQLHVDDSGDDDLLEIYLSALAVSGRSEKTIFQYRYVISRLIKGTGTPSRHMTVYHIRRYLSDEKNRGIADRTLECNRQVFTAYFNWLQREGMLQSNPTSNLGAIKYQKRVKTTYSDIDIEKLKNACRTVRDKAIISFLLTTGCRISEMVALNISDVDLNNLECKVLGKGNKERTVYIDAVTAMHIREYLFSRVDNNPALFIRRGKKRLKAGGIRCMLKSLSERCNVENVHPHKFRRTLATNLIRHGMPIEEVATILGHDKLDTTMQYVALDRTDVKNSYRKYA